MQNTNDDNNNNSTIVRIAIKLSNTLNYITSIPTRMYAFAKHVFTNESIKNDIAQLTSQVHTLEGLIEELRMEISTVDENSVSKDTVETMIDESFDNVNWKKRLDFSDILSNHESDICDAVRNNWELDYMVDESRVSEMIEESYDETEFANAVSQLVKKHINENDLLNGLAKNTNEQIRSIVFDVLTELLNNIKRDTSTKSEIRSDSNQ